MNAMLNIIYEDPQIIVCEKPHGIATQSRSFSSPDMERMIRNHLAKNGAKNPYLAVIHRLDQPVRGLLVFAKTPNAAKKLNQQLTSKGFGKHYLAIVAGTPSSESGTLTDYLKKDARTNTSQVCEPNTPNAKKAILNYKVIKQLPDNQSLLEVILDTGRHHQIRVQLSHMGCPIVGDTKYNKSASNSTWQTIQLCAYKLSFQHPTTGKHLIFEIKDFVKDTKKETR